MKKALLQFLLIPLAALALLINSASADNFNFTAYYPAPMGSYSGIQLVPQSAITPDTDCDIGTIYSNADNNSIPYYCTPNTTPPPSSQFLQLPAVWSLYNDAAIGPRMYIAESPANKMIGIGTTTPIFKLTLDQDGGILADNTTNSYNMLPASYINGAGTRLLFYPLKRAFRAGYVPGTQWDDSNLGTNSTAMGYGNRASGQYSTILGGQSNTLTTNAYGFIGGGLNNTSDARGSTTLGGEKNVIVAGAINYQHVASGYNNTLNCSTAGCDILGGLNNAINSTTRGVTIAGGDGNLAQSQNVFIGGGAGNRALSTHATVLGGRQNTASSLNTAVLGGHLNNTSGFSSVIAGGYNNSINASGTTSTISGGANNTANGYGATVSGGDSNTASGSYSTIAGGQSNTASGNSATVMGGKSNIASGQYSIVVGGEKNNTAADYSLVAGRNMALSAAAARTFLWGINDVQATITTPDAFIIFSGKMGLRDTAPAAMFELNANGTAEDYMALTSATTAVTAGNKFIIKNNGIVSIGVVAPANPLEFSNGAYVDAAGTFLPASSRKYKENFAKLDDGQASEILSGLTPVKFHYKNEKDEEYVGFIAEDVPQLVVNKARTGLAPLDFIAVLNKVIQRQQKTLEEQQKAAETLTNELKELKTKIKARRDSGKTYE